MLAAATSFFARTAISQSYTFTGSASQGSRTATPTPSGSLPVVSHAAPFHVGPWKIQAAVHKTTNKRVSIWTYDKRSQEAERLNPSAKDRVVEVLKAEVGFALRCCEAASYALTYQRLQHWEGFGIRVYWVAVYFVVTLMLLVLKIIRDRDGGTIGRNSI